LRRNPVRREKKERAVRNVVERLDKNDAATLKIANDPSVMHDFVINVRSFFFVANDVFEDVDRSVDAGAKTARFG